MASLLLLLGLALPGGLLIQEHPTAPTTPPTASAPSASPDPSAQTAQTAQPEAEATAGDEAPPPLSSEPGLVQSAPARVALGEWFDVLVTGPLDPHASLGFLQRPEDVIARGSRIKTTITGAEVRLSMAIARPGNTRLESLVLRDGERLLALDPIEIEVTLDLPPEHVPRVAPPLGPIGLRLPRAPVWLLGGLILSALALIGAWVVRATRDRPVLLAVTPPDQLAMAALERLRLETPRTSDQVARLVLEVSDVLRAYIEGRFGVHAPARTTEEFLVEALRQPELSSRKDALDRFLTLCDLVKYARLRPAASEATGLIESASDFVEQTR